MSRSKYPLIDFTPLVYLSFTPFHPHLHSIKIHTWEVRDVGVGKIERLEPNQPDICHSTCGVLPCPPEIGIARDAPATDTSAVMGSECVGLCTPAD